MLKITVLMHPVWNRGEIVIFCGLKCADTVVLCVATQHLFIVLP